jgi:hypothetical protein
MLEKRIEDTEEGTPCSVPKRCQIWCIYRQALSWCRYRLGLPPSACDRNLQNRAERFWSCCSCINRQSCFLFLTLETSIRAFGSITRTDTHVRQKFTYNQKAHSMCKLNLRKATENLNLNVNEFNSHLHTIVVLSLFASTHPIVVLDKHLCCINFPRIVTPVFKGRGVSFITFSLLQ